MSERIAIASIRRLGAGPARTDQDLVAVEAPLAIDLVHGDGEHSITRPLGLAMRTPGDDGDLIKGLLFAEGIIRADADVVAIDIRPADDAKPDDGGERARVMLGPSVAIERIPGSRTLMPTTACGLCGRLEWTAIERRASAPDGSPREVAPIPPSTISRLPSVLRHGQTVFAETGGLHAAALCDLDGELRVIREDVGRHNAVDKVVGAALAMGLVPGPPLVLVVSGRVAFEIVQKAVVAGVRAIVAVGAPSSLAVDAARAAGVTLVGFARDGRFNVYTGHDLIGEDAPELLK